MCEGSGKPPRKVNGDKGTGWCSHCRDQHVLLKGVVPFHNTERGTHGILQLAN